MRDRDRDREIGRITPIFLGVELINALSIVLSLISLNHSNSHDNLEFLEIILRYSAINTVARIFCN